MSRQTISLIMNRLLTDDDLRRYFSIDRIAALGELHARSLELTAPEIDLFLASDLQMWSWTDPIAGDRVH